MGHLLDAWRQHLAAAGRTMTLRRISSGAPVTVSVVGALRMFNPDDLTGAVKQATAQIKIGHDEIVAASWPHPPRSPDQVLADGVSYTIEGAAPVCEGATIIGWTLFVGGGG